MNGVRVITRRRLAAITGAALVCVTTALAVPATVQASRESGEAERQRIMHLVAAEARNMGIPQALALAVAHVESNFDSRALSHKGARGVMQIMPATARGEYGIAPGLLWNPRINVRLGLHFLGRLLDRYAGRVDLALFYYNGGSAVGDLPHARVIPATRKYVRKVQQFRRVYSRELARRGTEIGYRLARKSGARGGSERGAGGMLPDSTRGYRR